MTPEPVHTQPRVFQNNLFLKFAHKNGLTDADLCATVRNLQAGIIDADLGGGLYKQRVPRRGAGKSSGFRTILIFQFGRYCVFVYAFAKKDRPNITPRELAEFKVVAKAIRTYDDETYNEAVRSQILHEIFCEKHLP